MGFFGKLKREAKNVQNRDLMQAIVAGCLLVSAADGEVEKEELDKMTKLLSINDKLSTFKSEIATTVQKYSDTLDVDFKFGKKKMLDELADITDQDQAEEIMLMVLAVASADGEVDDKETSVMEEIAKALNVSLKQFV